MSDNNEAPQIVVPATPTMDQISAGLRSLGLVIAAIVALSGFVSKHDAAGFVSYVQSGSFLSAASIVVAAATFVWGQWKTRHRSLQLTRIVSDPRVPDAVGVVQGSAGNGQTETKP